jgi:hypothetical protein
VSRRWLPLAAGGIAFALVVLGVVAWALFGGQAGTQRGLVLRSEVGATVTVTFEDGREAELSPGARQRTFVVKREEFPQRLRAVDAAGTVVAEQVLTYDEIAVAEFRISLDRNGFYPTTEIRTPAP